MPSAVYRLPFAVGTYSILSVNPEKGQVSLDSLCRGEEDEEEEEEIHMQVPQEVVAEPFFYCRLG